MEGKEAPPPRAAAADEGKSAAASYGDEGKHALGATAAATTTTAINTNNDNDGQQDAADGKSADSTTSLVELVEDFVYFEDEFEDSMQSWADANAMKFGPKSLMDDGSGRPMIQHQLFLEYQQLLERLLEKHVKDSGFEVADFLSELRRAEEEDAKGRRRRGAKSFLRTIESYLEFDEFAKMMDDVQQGESTTGTATLAFCDQETVCEGTAALLPSGGGSGGGGSAAVTEDGKTLSSDEASRSLDGILDDALAAAARSAAAATGSGIEIRGRVKQLVHGDEGYAHPSDEATHIFRLTLIAESRRARLCRSAANSTASEGYPVPGAPPRSLVAAEF
eukprot:g4232.t1